MSEPVREDNLEELAELVLKEMLGRVKKNPDDVSTPVLSRLATDLNRFIERRSKVEDEEEHKPFSLWDEIGTLPPDRQRVLVEEEAARVRAELERCEVWLAGSVPDSQERV